MILVTGATGFVGRSLIRELARQGKPSKAFAGRINDSFAVRADLLDVDTVIHLASAESRDRIRLLEHVDIDGTELLLRECQRAGANHFIYVSRLKADPYSLFGLLRIKGVAEKLVRRSGLPYTIVRSATLFGREDRFLNVIGGLAAWTWPFIWLPGGGKAAMQPLWVEDLVRCLAMTLDKNDLKGTVLEVAGQERMHYKEIAHLVMVASGMRRIPLSPNMKLLRPLSAMLFGWWRYAPVTRFFMDRLSIGEVAPVDSIREHYGFRPALIGRQISFLRRSGLGWRLFRLG
jgi:NADH dehydrogenase